MKNSSKHNIKIMQPKLPRFDQLQPYLEQIDASGIYTNLGPLVRRFEQKLADTFDVPAKRVITTSNCTSALHLSILGKKKTGASYCLLPSWTFVATAHAVKAAGLEPYFLDVDKDTQQLSFREVLRALNKLGPDAVASIVLVAPYGSPIDLEKWETFQSEFDIPVILDAAAAFDTTRASKITTCVSLHATKVMPAGEGGLILATEDDNADAFRAGTNFGFYQSREAVYSGMNAKMSEYHAAIGLASLKDWQSTKRRLLHICSQLSDGISRIDGVKLQDGFGQSWFSNTTQIQLENSDVGELKSFLTEKGIETRRWWSTGCHKMKAFEQCKAGDLAVTEKLAATTISLPSHANVQANEVSHILNSLEEYFRQSATNSAQSAA